MNCGAGLARHCLNCQAELPPNARFCMNCGQAAPPASAAAAAPAAPAAVPTRPVIPAVAPPAASPMAGERRMVTVLFADISGFTALSEKMDPEQVRGLMNACFDRLVPSVEKYGGVVDKFIGDEIMALFGAPVAHEDDPTRALRASLEMMETLEQFNEQHGVRLGMHAGVNTGLVVSGGIGSQGRQQYSVMGDAVNLAARLEDASTTGEILVGPDTHRLTAPLFNYEALPPIALKGKAEPVAVYRLLGLKERPGRIRGLAGLSSPMVGRQGELNAMLQLGEAVQAGLGRVAVLVGEPGLGKSRLLAEWRAALTERYPATFRWAEGNCVSYGQGLAYHLLIDLLRSLIGVNVSAGEHETAEALEALSRRLFGETALDVYPYLAHLLSLPLEGPALERVRMLDPQALQAQYLSSLRQLGRSLASSGPLVLVLEDIHWADPSSTDLLVKLLSLASETAILFCFTTRPERDAPGWKLVTAARELMGASLAELSLQTLSEHDSRELIANLLEIEALPETVRALILRKAEGNPFFVEEVIRMLIDRSLIVRSGQGWKATGEIENVEIPDNLQGLLLARIDRLPEEVRHTLRVASVIGRQFSVRVLEGLKKRT
jgi:class 3 adenylate cyclase